MYLLDTPGSYPTEEHSRENNIGRFFVYQIDAQQYAISDSDYFSEAYDDIPEVEYIYFDRVQLEDPDFQLPYWYAQLRAQKMNMKVEYKDLNILKCYCMQTACKTAMQLVLRYFSFTKSLG